MSKSKEAEGILGSIVLCILVGSIVKWWFAIISIPIMYVLYKRVQYEISGYRLESGATFWKTKFDKGRNGEYLAFLELEKVKGNARLITNIHIPKVDKGTTELDVVFIHEKGIFVIESKNYSASISILNKNRWKATYSRKTKYNKGKNIYFKSPIKQNDTHVKAVIKCLDVDSECVYSVIVFSGVKYLKEDTEMKDNVAVIKRKNLLKTIKNIIKTRDTKFSKAKIDEMYNILKKLN